MSVPGYLIHSRHAIPWLPMLRFFRQRKLPGVEQITETAYQRAGLTITCVEERSLHVTGPRTADVTERLRRMFDLDVDQAAISAHLGMSPVFLPGAWCPFELAVRAVLGQQISVAGARTLAGRLAALGEGTEGTAISPERVASAALESMGVLPSRARTLRALAERAQAPSFHYQPDQLLAIPGIGPWTAAYIGMRAMRDADAFPAGDLILRRVAIPSQVLTERALTAHAERWRPYRAYAAIALWNHNAHKSRPD